MATITGRIHKWLKRLWGIDPYVQVTYYANIALITIMRHRYRLYPLFAIAQTDSGKIHTFQWVKHLGWVQDHNLLAHLATTEGLQSTERYADKWGWEKLGRLHLIMWSVPEFSKQTMSTPHNDGSIDMSGYS